MKTLLAALVASSALFLTTGETAQAQWRGSYRGYSPYYGGYSPYYSGYGVRNFSYGTTLPGGSYYGYTYSQPNYTSGGFGGPGVGYINPNGGFSATSFGYSYPAPYVVFPSYGYRPGSFSFYYR